MYELVLRHSVRESDKGHDRTCEGKNVEWQLLVDVGVEIYGVDVHHGITTRRVKIEINSDLVEDSLDTSVCVDVVKDAIVAIR